MMYDVLLNKIGRTVVSTGVESSRNVTSADLQLCKLAQRAVGELDEYYVMNSGVI